MGPVLELDLGRQEVELETEAMGERPVCAAAAAGAPEEVRGSGEIPELAPGGPVALCCFDM